MFSTLLETKRARQRSLGSTITSSVLHIFIVIGAVYATATGNETEPKPDDSVTYTEVIPKPEPPTPRSEPPTPPQPDRIAPPRHGFQTLTAPIDIPTVIPDIDLSLPPTNPDDFRGKGVPGGIFNGTPSDTTNPDAVRFIFEVESAARLAPGNPEPNYPALMQKLNQTGIVRVSFVIDTSGRAVMQTLKVLEATNNLFADEVRTILKKYRFIPALIGEIGRAHV